MHSALVYQPALSAAIIHWCTQLFLYLALFKTKDIIEVGCQNVVGPLLYGSVGSHNKRLPCINDLVFVPQQYLYKMGVVSCYFEPLAGPIVEVGVSMDSSRPPDDSWIGRTPPRCPPAPAPAPTGP